MARPSVTVLPSAGAVADEALRLLIAGLDDAQRRRGVADLVLAGGSTPVAVYLRLAAIWRVAAVDWGRVRLWLGDERFVPESHPDSNAGMIRRALLGDGGVPFPAANVHFFPVDEALATGGTPRTCADRYAADLLTTLERDARGRPVIDLLIAGIGPDGHTLSIFPGSRALGAPAGHVIDVPAPVHIEPHVARVTLTPRWIARSRSVLVLATGGSKASIVGRIFGTPREPRRLPAQLLLGRNASWLLDLAAAAGLSGIEPPAPDRA